MSWFPLKTVSHPGHPSKLWAGLQRAGARTFLCSPVSKSSVKNICWGSKIHSQLPWNKKVLLHWNGEVGLGYSFLRGLEFRAHLYILYLPILFKCCFCLLPPPRQEKQTSTAWHTLLILCICSLSSISLHIWLPKCEFSALFLLYGLEKRTWSFQDCCDLDE